MIDEARLSLLVEEKVIVCSVCLGWFVDRRIQLTPLQINRQIRRFHNIRTRARAYTIRVTFMSLWLVCWLAGLLA